MDVHYWSIRNQENVEEPKEHQDVFNIFCNLTEDYEPIEKGMPAVNAFMIADGHGDSSIIARKAIDFFTNTFCFTKTKFPLSQKAATDRFEIFHKIVAKDTASIASGSTLLMLFLFPHQTREKALQYQVVNLGDCRVIGFDTSGSCIRLSGDHSFSSQHEKKRIEAISTLQKSQGIPQRIEKIVDDDGTPRLRGLAVSRAFGNSFSERRAEIIDNSEESDDEYPDREPCLYINVMPDVFKQRYVTDLDRGITPNGSLFFVLGSDGLYDSLDDSTVADKVLEYADAEFPQYFEYGERTTDHYGDNVYQSESNDCFCLQKIIQNKKNTELKKLVSKPLEMDAHKISKNKINIAERLCRDAANTPNYAGEPNLDNITCIVIEIKPKIKNEK